MSAAPRTCNELGVCQSRNDCACGTPTPPEAGNVHFPDDDALMGPPFTRGEKVFLTLLIMAYVALLAWIVTSVGEYAIERFFTTH